MDRQPALDASLEQVLYQVKRVIVGQDALLERMVVALLARGHLLVEGVPGLAKTMAVKTLAQAIGGEFQRIQFTPDLVPADIVGTRIFNQKLGEFQVSLGPVFANLVLADEINRAPAKVQSALLEAMQERQVTIGRETHPLPDPFLVMATQNPIESEGTYPLPEAQVDRFMLKVLIDYPTPTEEFVIVERMTAAFEPAGRAIDAEHLAGLQRAADEVFVDPSLIEYSVKLANATRNVAAVGLGDLSRYITFGASPRASINLILAGRALALVRGREYALPQDLREIAPDVLRHRMMLSYEALADGVTPDAIIDRILAAVPVPGARAARAHGRVGARHLERDTATARALSTRVETPERVLHRLEWQVIRRLDGRLQGNYRTIFRGVGTDFHDLREYEPGDDVRHIDWNVTARMDTPFLRQYVEDRELTAWLLLDRSPSMGFGPIDRPKELVLTELATTFARLLTRGGNPVGAILFDSEVESTIQPRSGRNQVLALTRSLMQPPTARGAITDLTGPLEFALGAIRRRSLIVLLSDFITAPGWERPLLQLTERHEVVAIRLIDPREYELPDAGVIVVEDTETGEQLTVDSSDAEFRHRLREAGEAREAELRAADAPRRRRHLRGLDRGRPRARPRPHRRVAEAAALMSLGSPWMLLLLAVVPLLVLAYVSALRRRGRRAARLASEGLVPTTAGRRQRRRHIPFALFAAGIALVVFGLARPTVNLPVPEREGTVILAFDVSNSMRAKDLEPSRIEAAKVAARAFVEKQPSTIKIGVVAFGDSAVTVLKPSNVKEDVLAAINRLSVSGGTSLGQGLFTSLSTIAGKPLKIDDSALESDAGERQHRLLRLLGDRPALRRGEHDPARPARARRGRLDRRRPRARDRRRHRAGNRRAGRRLQRRDGTRRRHAEGDRRHHRRHLRPGERCRRADRDLQVDRPRVQDRQEAARGDGAVLGRRRAPSRARLGALDPLAGAGGLT